MSDTATESITPKSTGSGKAKGVALNIIPPLLFGALVLAGWYFISYVMLAENRRFLPVSYTHLTLPTNREV